MAHPDTLSGGQPATEAQARGVGMYEWYEDESRHQRCMRQLRQTRKWAGITIAAGGVVLMASAMATLPPVFLFLSGLVGIGGGAALWVEGDRQ